MKFGIPSKTQFFRLIGNFYATRTAMPTTTAKNNSKDNNCTLECKNALTSAPVRSCQALKLKRESFQDYKVVVTNSMHSSHLYTASGMEKHLTVFCFQSF